MIRSFIKAIVIDTIEKLEVYKEIAVLEKEVYRLTKINRGINKSLNARSEENKRLRDSLAKYLNKSTINGIKKGNGIIKDRLYVDNE